MMPVTRWETAGHYTVTPLFDITGDSAVALYWNPAGLAAAASRTYTTYYGIGGINACQDPLGISVGVSGPAQVGVDSTGCMPANPAFTIIGYVQNDTGADLVATESLTLTLPAGLALAPGETATHALPLIANASVGSDILGCGSHCRRHLYITRLLNHPVPLSAALLFKKTWTFWQLREHVPAPMLTLTAILQRGQCGSIDCNDADAAINPGAIEVCGNAIDDNCNGQIDEGCGPANTCDDGICNGTENCTTCAADCGTCLPICGDSVCDGTETRDNCEVDCGIRQPVCGDGICNGSEDCASCSADCSLSFYPDADVDTFGDALAAATLTCVAPAGLWRTIWTAMTLMRQ